MTIHRNIWVCTDTHFGHRALEEYCGRPPNFEEVIYKNLLSHVKPKDTLIHLGDICMGNDAEHHKKYIQSIPCTKILILGNHDKKSRTWYAEHGWDFVCDRFGMEYYGIKFLFSHKPVVDDQWYDVNLHGHFHNTTHRYYEPELVAIRNKKQHLLCYEDCNYTPLNLRNFAEKLNINSSI